MIEVLLGLIPGLLFFFYFFLIFKPKTKEKRFFILLFIIIGAIGAYITYRLEWHFGSYFKKTKESNYFEILFYAIFGVAIFEEGYKLLTTLFVSFFDKKIEKYNMLLYSIFSAIGFATAENIVFYSLRYGSSVGISRLFTAVPSQIIDGIWMGLLLELYNKTKSFKKNIYLFLSLIIPTLIHALYNSFLYGGGKYSMYFKFYYIPLIIITIIFYILYFTKKKSH